MLRTQMTFIFIREERSSQAKTQMHNMAGSLILLFLSLLVPSLADRGSSVNDDKHCNPRRCHRDGPEIRFPFRLNDQPRRCGYPGFEVSCRANRTVLHLPSHADGLNISSISYEDRSLRLLNPYKCFMDFVLHLNLSASNLVYSPNCRYGSASKLRYAYRLYCNTQLSTICGFQYPCYVTYVECLEPVKIDYSSLFVEVPCGENQVYVALSGFDWAMLPSNCTKGKSISIPTTSITSIPIPTTSIPIPTTCNYQNYLSDVDSDCNSKSTLSLSWVIPGCEYCSGRCQFVNSTTNETSCLYDDYKNHKDLLPYDNYENHKGKPMKYVITGIVVSLILIILAAVAAYKIHQYQKSNREKIDAQRKVDKFLEDYKSLKPTRYTYADVKRMANHWKSKLGEGGYGSVFEGKLPNETPVAVKVLKISTTDGEDFINEVSTIGRIHHINVVRLLGFCADGFNRALIYEFMPNQSLDKFIFAKEGKKNLLTWEILQDIANGMARGIEYLHQGCDQRILHFDIKPSNILLDQNFIPKISDFGLAKLCSKEMSIVSMTAVRGTMGYIAPEILSRNCRNVSCKSDIYSFGMLLLEMVGGRKNIDAEVENTSQVYFPEWIYNRLNNGQDLGLNISLEGEGDIAKKLTIVALWCIQWYPVDRPPMKKVIQMLQENVDSLVMPPNPFVEEDTQDMMTTARVEPQTSNLEVILE